MHQKLFGKVLTFNPAKNVPIPLSKGASVYFSKPCCFEASVWKLNLKIGVRGSANYVFTMHISALER